MLKKFYGQYLKDAVYAANDGIITTFAVVAGVVGAQLSPVIILILGFANLLADGFSMASGNYLGTKSQSHQFDNERKKEERIFAESEEKARQEIRKILNEKGYKNIDVEIIANSVAKNKKFFLDFIIFERLGFTPRSRDSAFKGATITLLTFLLVGSLPLLPYVIFNGAGIGNTFLWASAFTGIALFITGAASTIYTDRVWWSSGLEMLFVGGLAAVIAYIIGALLRGLVTGII